MKKLIPIIYELAGINLGSKKSLSDVLDDYYHWQSLNIIRPLLWLEQLRKIIVGNRLRNKFNKTQPGEKPLAVMIYPKSDYNGSFSDLRYLQELSAHYTVLYYEVSSVEEMIASLKNATHHQKSSLVIIGGYGTPHSIQFSHDDKLTINHYDQQALIKARLSNMLMPGAIGILISCSTGSPRIFGPNIADVLAGAFKVEILAPNADTYI